MFASDETPVAGPAISDLRMLRPIPETVPRYLHEFFETSADAYGKNIAVVCGEISISYEVMEARANRLAHYLRHIGIGRGTTVGLYFDRSELPIVAILACLKSGAAYVPIDPIHPDERIQYIVGEAEIAALVTETSLLGRAQKVFAGSTVVLDQRAAEINAQSAARLSRTETGLCPDDLCYVIYTSGSTGRPKGVMTEHRNACHFVSAFNERCETTSKDCVYQGFPLGFDGSVEEIWMAFSNGATLVVSTKETPRFGDDLARYLARQRVTYLSTVPTMLSTITEDIPSLRQLVVSGEVCPQELVHRWARPGRRMFNVYGPTEATVNATVAVCEPGQPITIGLPLKGYDTVILDADRRAVPPGEKGELYIGGSGIARGYLKQPELTSRHFVTSPESGTRLYRTGDLVRFNNLGELEYFGRIDDQVKIRGYRVELSEIEAVLLKQPHVVSAAVNVHDRNGVPTLAGYVVLDRSSLSLDRSKLLKELQKQFPPYMVPAYLDVLDSIPTLTTGKIDRRRLPAPVLPLIDEDAVGVPPKTPLERDIAEAWAQLFQVPRVGAEQNFFLDLGGHSLLAAQMTAMVRSRAKLHIAVRDVYSFPTVRTLAEHLEQRGRRTPEAPSAAPSPVASALRKPGFWSAIFQASAMVSFRYLFTLPLLVVLPYADDVLRARLPIVDGSIIFIGYAIALWLLILSVSIGAKWVIIGRYKPGAYPLWGSYYLRWWLVSRLQALSGIGLLTGTPLVSVYFRLMGAKVGRHCALETAQCSIWDLVSIGDDASVGADTQLSGCRVENGHLIIGAIHIGNQCFIGQHSALGLNVTMEDRTRLDDQSLLPDGATIPADEHWRGSPAKPGEVEVPPGAPRRDTLGRQIVFTVAAFVTGILSSLFLALPVLGCLYLGLIAFQDGWLLQGLLVLSAAIPWVVIFFCFWVAALKALQLRRARPGIYPLYSAYYLRHWLSNGLMRASRAMFLPVFTTIYLPPWMRLLGAKIGRHVEMSTVWTFTPELLIAGEGSFFADGCMLGGRRTFGGRFEIRPNRVGQHSFIGNSAILPTNSTVGDRCLLGVLSTPPVRSQPVPDGSDWLGSPGFRLPNRQKVGGFSEQQTYQPTLALYLHRGVIDACRILIPAYTGFLLGLGALVATLYGYETLGVWATVVLAPILLMILAAIRVAIVVGLKWLVMGKFKPVIVPLWSQYVWLNEMVNGAYESIMAPVVSGFSGTPFAAPLLRMLGCNIGRHCYIATALFSEFDLVNIGDYVALNAGAIIQNHLFEDRIMKSSRLKIGDGCTVGNMSVVLYDSCMEPGAVLEPLSLLMKGEIQPAGSRWHGIPTVEG